MFVMAITCRDDHRRSHVFLADAVVRDGEIAILSELKAALEPGAPGHFDCDGAISGCFVEHEGARYLYYVGWQNLPEGMWICDTGRAVVDIENRTLRKEFPGPIIGRDRTNPLFAAATAFYITGDGVWHAWYNSGIEWRKGESGWDHKYGFHYASSRNGLDWRFRPGMAIPFADEYEYAFGRPSVVFWDGTYHMWFAHRASRDIATYRIGYASSTDLVNWDRDDSRSGIDVSVSGWDSEMICYPCVFEHKGVRYMLYNGNGYGRTGVGYAVLEEDR